MYNTRGKNRRWRVCDCSRECVDLFCANVRTNAKSSGQSTAHHTKNNFAHSTARWTGTCPDQLLEHPAHLLGGKALPDLLYLAHSTLDRHCCCWLWRQNALFGSRWSHASGLCGGGACGCDRIHGITQSFAHTLSSCTWVGERVVTYVSVCVSE